MRDYYDTYIFDLDDTLWSGHWAKMLVGNFITKHPLIIEDELGNKLALKYGVKNFLKEKSKVSKIGFVSRGGLIDIDKHDQPSIKVLRTFGILDYFNYCRHTIYKTEDKSKYVNPSGHTLYVDDNENDLNDVREKNKDTIFANSASLDTINANEFNF
tara:strand:+ start:261 stop:731 length:471 start_codon:yes stop_codon:yes gene_type:complete